MNISIVILGVLLLAAGLIVGFLAGYLRGRRRAVGLERELTRLETLLESERTRTAEQRDLLEQARKQLTDTFQALAGNALKANNEQFLKLARENLNNFQTQAKNELEKREKGVAELVKPISEALRKTEEQIQRIEKERKEAYGSISRYLETMTRTQQQLESETRNLVKALRRPEVRGQWGELTLRRLAELAGMVDHCDFYEQEHHRTEDGAMRPDMIVRLPNQRELVVDVKTPLDSYLTAVEATDDTAREAALAHHARKVRERVRELATKSYWNQFKNSPEFVILFIPGEQFLSAALDRDPALLEDALEKKVIVATPTSLVALLKAVAYGWRQEALAENAEHIRDLASDLYGRLGTFANHLATLGRSLGQSVDRYNKAVGSLERNVLPGARRFAEMGVHARKPIENLEPVDQNPRSVDIPERERSEDSS
ncbi:MAG: DNA recombination protein RmuC [Gammaproteobacteria bacterium]|jgi:DNA recombination protein RmuC